MNQGNGRAFRHELKYAINPAQQMLLRKKLAAVMLPDPHAAPGDCYQIRSVYFDDFKDTALREKLAGVMQRKKYRLRMYDFDDSLIKLERKSKVDQYVSKESSLITRDKAEMILSGKIGFMSGSTNLLMKQFYTESRLGLFKPVVIVDYYREAYTCPVGNVRITLDTRLSTSLSSAPFFSSTPSPLKAFGAPEIILEVKFNEVLPQHLRGIFPDNIRPRSAIGKFAICRTQQLQALGFNAS